MLARAAPPSGFIEPCLPSPAKRPPTGPDWVHEIKHDGYRLMARRDPVSVGIRLLTRNGHDWASRYPLIVQAVNNTQGAQLPDRWRGGVLQRVRGAGF